MYQALEQTYRALDAKVSDAGRKCIGRWKKMYRALDGNVSGSGRKCIWRWTQTYRALDGNVIRRWTQMYQEANVSVSSVPDLEDAASGRNSQHKAALP